MACVAYPALIRQLGIVMYAVVNLVSEKKRKKKVEILLTLRPKQCARLQRKTLLPKR
jgi:hypothetical protein